MEDDWKPVGESQPPADDWAPVGQAPATPGFIASIRDHVEPILNAFGQGFREGFGPERMGLPDEDVKWLSKVGIFAPGDSDRYTNPMHAANELLIDTLYRTGQLAFRVPSGVFRGVQAAGIEAGLPRDVVAMPEAFFGSPHPTGIPGRGIAEGTRAATIEGLRQQGNIEIRPTPPEMRAAEAPTMPEAPTEPRPPLAVEARQLGVIGPERPEPTFNDSPTLLAKEATPTAQDLSAARSPESARTILGHEPGEYDARGKEWINKIDEPNDVRDVIEKIASDNDFFPASRGGIASEAARDTVAEAAGVGPAEINESYFSTHFDGDGKVRAVIQVLRQTAKDFMEASKKATNDPTPENLAAAAEAELRHSHAVEYMMGVRAESGRTLAAHKDLLRQTEETRAKVNLHSQEQTGKAPKGTSDVVDAVGEVRDNLKAGKTPGLQKLIDAAKSLVDNADKPAEPGQPKEAPSPEVKSLVDEARNVLKRFGGEKKDAELEAFRDALTKLSEGQGKLGDTLEAARALVEKNAKARAKAEAEPKAPSAKSQLNAAAKRLVAAADNEQAKAKITATPELQRMMETTRQAVGLLKTQNLSSEMRDFRAALNSNNAEAAETAARNLIEAEGKAKSEVSNRAPVEYDQIMSAARRVATAGEKIGKEKPELMPDVKAALEQARSAASELQGEQKTALGRLIDTAERNALNMTKQKAVKDPFEALPPELQALVDKTKRVVDRFGGIARGERAALLMARTGRTFDEQQKIVQSFAGLSPNQVAKILNKLRTSPDAARPGWFYWMWQQGLISGLITHSKYAIVNTATLFLERVVSPFFGAVLDRLRGENTSIAGPLYANIAMVHALPDAISAAAQAFKTGMRVPLESEIQLFRRGEESPQTKGAAGAYMQTSAPDWGIWNRVFNETQLDQAAKVLGIPGKSANMLHTFYKVLSEQASNSTRAFQAAHEEGVKGDAFWQRYRYHLDNPTDDALRGAVNDAYTGAFMAKLGPKMTTFTHALSKNPVTKWLFPFQHIPWNIERMSIEYSPFAVLGPEMRSAILGQKGVPAQNLAIAKMTVGSSVIGYFMHKALSGTATGDYPLDQKERRKWEDLDIRPNSIQIGNQWVGYERLGPIGNVAHMGAAIGSIIKQYNGQDDDALTKAIWTSAVAAANQVGNEVGFQSLKNLIEALENQHRAERFIAWQGGSFLPMSSFISQNASIIDPYQRKANTLIDGLKYRVPFLRETLLPKRDFFGEPVPNPSYHTITPMGPVNTDPVKQELARLDIPPAPLQDRIGGVKLTPKLLDEYQVVVGSLAKTMLEPLVRAPGWSRLPPNVQIDTLHSRIKSAHELAQSIMQARHPELITSGMEQRKDYITGNTLTPRPKNVPEAVKAIQP